MIMEINWCEPPVKIHTRKEFVNELKQRPKTWALFRESTYASVSHEVTRYYPGVKATARKVGVNDKGIGMYDIYLMWDPEGEVK
jgi:hypothetical protein